ncbi:MAG: ATP-grasp domain-containing protein [Candidatus Thiodiazotropha sp.]
MSADSTSLLVLANSGRAVAESARRGGYKVTLLDRFCDQDSLAVADCWPVTQGFSRLDVEMFAKEMAAIIPEYPCGLVYGAGLEGSTQLLRQLSSCCQLYGNDPSVLELLRRPRRLFPLLTRLQIPFPEVSFRPPYTGAEKSWLIKQAASCGGQGVAYFSHQRSAAESDCYYQKYIPGQVMSVLFIADGARHHNIGYNLLGMNGSGASSPFLYSGAITQATVPDRLRTQVELVVEKLVTTLGLRGVNSLDFVHNDAGIFVIDINPRPTATLELYEHLTADGWIKHHIQACRGELPVAPTISSALLHGHQILYASKAIEISANVVWPQWAKDRPLTGTRIEQGQPICSLYAQAATTKEVKAELLSYRDEMLRILGSPLHQPIPRRVAI